MSKRLVSISIRSRLALVVAICSAALLALPSMAAAETWASQYPFGSVNVQPKTITVDVIGAAALKYEDSRHPARRCRPEDLRQAG